MSNQMVDWLANVEKIGGEFSWITTSRQFFDKDVGRSPSDINKSVLNSTRIKNAIKKKAESKRCSRKEVEQEAAKILEDMAHNFQLSSVKPIAYGVLKAIRKIFTSIFVNFSQLEKLRQFGVENPTIPIVFLPTHKSYFDFLLISLLCFDQQIRPPAIAAGEDFKSSKLLGEALRRCGAWFIKRSFGEVLVPITINYEKLLEESLYAWELLGYPKPKETTSGLFKAREILNKNFGNVYCTFGDPISVRQHFSSGKKSADDYRLEMSCMPVAEFLLSEQLKLEIKNLAYSLVEQHNLKNVLNIWPVICCSILEACENNSSIMYSTVMQKTYKLLDLLASLGIQITLLKESVEADANYFFDLHNNFISIQKDHIEFVTNVNENAPELIYKSISILITTNYSNLLISSLIKFCWIANSFNVVNNMASQGSNLADVWLHFEFLQDLFGQEFVSTPINRSFVFNNALDSMIKANILHLNGNFINVGGAEAIKLLANLFEPWIECYLTILQEILVVNKEQVQASSFLSWCQKRIAFALQSKDMQGRILSGSMSTDTIKNVFNTLRKMRYLFSDNEDVRVNAPAIEELVLRLKGKISNFSINNSKI